MNKQFLLDEDKRENRQFQLIVDGTGIKQENKTNPRIRRMSARSANEFMSVSESLPDYEVRVILNKRKPAFSLQSVYQIVFDSTSKQSYKAVDIRASNEPDLYTKIFVVKIP